MTIIPFYGLTGLHGCFSNFYATRIEYDGRTFASSEHVFMYMKAVHFNDLIIANAIVAAATPTVAKALGRRVSAFNEDVWDKVRYNYMVQALTLKFGQNEGIKKILKGTAGHTLVEASPRDRIWGVGMSASNPDIHDPNKWRGRNLLGRALMEVRDT